MGACIHAKRGKGLNIDDEPLLLDNDDEGLAEWELKSKSREKMEEDMSALPKFVLLGLEDYAQDNVVRLVRKNKNGTLSHFAAPAQELKDLFADDEDDTYRSLHAKLYHVINGEFPGKDAHKNWFGWSTRKSNPSDFLVGALKVMKFYCYTLNSSDGWITEKARRRATMTDLQDVVAQKDFDLLVADFEKREMSKTLDIDPLVEAYEKAHDEMVEEVSDSGEESSSSEITSSSSRFKLFGRSNTYSHLPEEKQKRKSSFFSFAFKTQRHEFAGDEI